MSSILKVILLCFEFFFAKNQNTLAFHPGPVQQPGGEGSPFVRIGLVKMFYCIYSSKTWPYKIATKPKTGAHLVTLNDSLSPPSNPPFLPHLNGFASSSQIFAHSAVSGSGSYVLRK